MENDVYRIFKTTLCQNFLLEWDVECCVPRSGYDEADGGGDPAHPRARRPRARGHQRHLGRRQTKVRITTFEIVNTVEIRYYDYFALVPNESTWIMSLLISGIN